MSHAYALLLNMPLTRLLIADGQAWKIVGEADLGSDDPTAALEALRKAGEKIAGGSFSCVVVLPNDQVKYLSVPADGIDADVARAALDGATPYAVNDLSFDWTRTGERLYVAAVARETLAEARSFVTDHGFTPTAMVAHPDAKDFPARPLFEGAANLRGQAVWPLAGAYTAPAPQPVPDTAPEPEPASATEAEAAAPVAFASRREAGPVAPPVATKAPVGAGPRITLGPPGPSAAPSIAQVGAATPPPAKPAPAITGKSDVAMASAKAPPPPEPAPEDAETLRTPKAQIGGKPRYLGLILTLVLLGFLALVAIWSMTLGSPEEAAVETPAVASTPPADDTSVAAAPPETAAVLPDIDAPTEELLPDTATLALPPRTLTDTEAATLYEQSGIWQRAPREAGQPREADLDRLYVASIDPQVVPSDAIALPDAAALAADPTPLMPSDPVAPDQTYALDANGLVIPTADGALSPDGILVYTGRPPVTVALRPQAAEPAAPEPDARLAALRPQTRPDGLQDANERAQLGGRTLEEFASIRPELRPKAPQELAAEIAAAAAAASAAVQNAPERPTAPTTAPAAAPDPFATATQLASATSRKPQTRPGNFARLVERARARASEPTNEPAATESGAGRVVASVAPRAVRPSGPVPTTVSRAATMENAINLRRINLIGVFGKPNSRQALVRLRNGRFQKVQVGDRIDGGRVAAIGESELRYVKSGRNLTLTMPSG